MTPRSALFAALFFGLSGFSGLAPGLAAAGTAASSSTATQACLAGDPAMATEILARLNAERGAAGLPGLRENPTLSAAAQAHACDMAIRGYFNHQSPEGTMPWDRADAAGYRSCGAAENIAWGNFDAAAVMDGWMKSPGHRANILLDFVTEVGIGVAPAIGSAKPQFVQLFAKPC